MAADAQNLLLVRTDIAREQEADFNRWYTDVHLPEIVGVPGVRAGRRYRLLTQQAGFPGDGVPTYLALYELETPAALSSVEFAQVRGWGPFAAHVCNNKAAVYELLAAAGGG
jgi:hypothetical protein